MAHLGVCHTLEDRVQETRVAHVRESCSMGLLIVAHCKSSSASGSHLSPMQLCLGEGRTTFCGPLGDGGGVGMWRHAFFVRIQRPRQGRRRGKRRCCPVARSHGLAAGVFYALRHVATGGWIVQKESVLVRVNDVGDPACSERGQKLCRQPPTHRRNGSP